MNVRRGSMVRKRRSIQSEGEEEGRHKNREKGKLRHFKLYYGNI